MYHYISGTVTDIFDGVIVIEAGGIGYEVTATASCLGEFGKIGQAAKIHTYLHVKEDGVALYGFSGRGERTMFMRLIAVSGVGPKMAVQILSGIPTNALALAIVTGDTAALSRIKGVGKKTAERMVLELKDKLGGEMTGIEPGAAAIPAAADSDAVLALMALGFTRTEAASAVGRVETDGLTTEQIVMQALRR